MKKTYRLSALFLTSVMAFSAISGAVALAHEREPSIEIDLEQDVSATLEDSSNFVYDENGNIIDYWFADDFKENDRDVYFARPKCNSHNWELVFKFASARNGCQIKVYNKRCKKCATYMYQSWSTSSNI